jgi:prepilin-type N-terminal cleavage/methylation domain-containing protein
MSKKRGVTLVEVLVTAIILGLLAFIVVPQFSEASSNTKQSRLRNSLGIMRQKLELYKIEHDGQYPAADSAKAFIEKLTEKTNEAGQVVKHTSDEELFGPYLQNIPINPYTNGKQVKCGGEAGTGSADWIYDPKTGQFRANRPDVATRF